MRFLKTGTIPVLGMLVLLAGATPGLAALVGADFDRVDGSSPENWTRISGSGLYSNVFDETGTLSGIDLTLAGFMNIEPQVVNAGTVPIHTNNLSGLDAFVFSAQLSITISGLVSNGQYDLWLFGLQDLLVQTPVLFTAHVQGSELQQFDFSIETAGDLFINGLLGSSGSTLDSYAAPVTASNAGTIHITFTSEGEIGIAGFALQAIPEPASAGLLALGSLFMLRRRRAGA